MEKQRVYFKNLAALRFFAAFAVILHHVEQYKFWRGLPAVWGQVTIDALGHKAVSFFFVLSGFLISYLLLEEERKTGTISIKDFYVRRVLRIWPLYYLIVVLALFVVPYLFDLSQFHIRPLDDRFLLKLSFFLLILPNFLRTFAPNIVGANQLWSIGVEEQFYLMWPWLARIFHDRFLPFLLSFIAIKASTTFILDLLAVHSGNQALGAANHIWKLFKVEQMAIGAIGAWALFVDKKHVLDLCYHRVTFFASLTAMAMLFLVPFHHWIINYIEAVIFLVIILNVSTNPQIKISLETPALTKLGNISYGIYMYHTLCISMCLVTLINFGMHESNMILFNVMLYAGSVILTLFMAYFSYEYFEKVFLGLKERFMIVKSGKEKISDPSAERVDLERN